MPLRINGVHWSGLEFAKMCPAPDGLWVRSLDSLLNQIHGLGYNAIRLPFASWLLDPKVGVDPSCGMLGPNPDLKGLSALQVLDRIIDRAGASSLKIILAHVGDYPLPPSWIADWRQLARHYKGNQAIIGFDLHSFDIENGSHQPATWSEWKMQAEQAGNAILAENPDVLILVSGIGGMPDFRWPGSDLRAVKSDPLALDIPGRVVYSTKDYPTGAIAAGVQPYWFDDPTFPSNLPGLWDSSWGYLTMGDAAPVMLSEFGPPNLNSSLDQKWFQSIAGYLQRNQLSFAYFLLNPDYGSSNPNPGLLQSDWQTVNSQYQQVLQPLLGSPLP